MMGVRCFHSLITLLKERRENDEQQNLYLRWWDAVCDSPNDLKSNRLKLIILWLCDTLDQHQVLA